MKDKLEMIVQSIDAAFGRHYAKEHPELVGRYLIAESIHDIDETLGSTVNYFIESVSKAGLLTKLLNLGGWGK